MSFARSSSAIIAVLAAYSAAAIRRREAASAFSKASAACRAAIFAREAAKRIEDVCGRRVLISGMLVLPLKKCALMNPFSGSGKGCDAVDGTTVFASDVAFDAVIVWPSIGWSCFQGASRERASGGVDSTVWTVGACLLVPRPSVAAPFVTSG